MATPNVPIQTLDPRDDAPPAPTRLAQRPATLDGKVVGLFSNNKPHSLDLLRRIAAIIGRYDIAGTVEHNKANVMTSPEQLSTTRADGSGRPGSKTFSARRPASTWRSTPPRNEGPAPRAVCTTPWKPNCWESRPRSLPPIPSSVRLGPCRGCAAILNTGWQSSTTPSLLLPIMNCPSAQQPPRLR